MGKIRPVYKHRLRSWLFNACGCMSKAVRVLQTFAEQLQNRPATLTAFSSAGGLRCGAVASRMLSTDGSSDRTEVRQSAEEDRNIGAHSRPAMHSCTPPRPPPPPRAVAFLFPPFRPGISLRRSIRLRDSRVLQDHGSTTCGKAARC